MRHAKFLTAVSILAASVAYAQQVQRPNPSGFGSVLYPGLGGPPPPSAHGGFGSVLYPGTGAPGARVPVTRLPGTRPVGPPPAHSQHNRTVIVPVPVYYPVGVAPEAYAQQPAPSYDYGLADSSQGQGQSPVVILNQGYAPDNSYGYQPQRDYSSVAYEPAPEPRATIYLVAMTDHTIIPAIAYWVDGDTLSYITSEGVQNRVSVSLVDRDFSKQLNDDRHVEFKLPPVK